MMPPLKRLFLDSWGVFVCFLLIYVLLFTQRVLMDIPSQMYTLRQVCNGEVAMPPTALFYVLGWLGALGQYQSKTMLGIGAAITCAGLLTARWWITRAVFRNYFGGPILRDSWLAFALAFVCSLPTLDWATKGWYIIGQPSPNYWMNGTLLASWPFAIILFWQSYRQLLQPSAGWWRWMLLWLISLVISKPSYAFVFALVYPLFLIGRHGFNRAVRWQLLPFGILALLLALEFYLIFWQKDSVYVKQFNHGNQSGVQVCLFCVWRLFSSNILISVMAACLFPVGIAVLYWQEIRRKLLFWYAWAGFLTALVISVTFAQKGEEFSCWNFRWQAYIASHLLFMASTMLVWEKIQQEQLKWNARSKSVAILFLLQLLSGILYLGKMLWTQSHY